MIKLGHGADVVSMVEKYNKNEKDILDFSSNINPCLPENIEKHILEGLQLSSKYPDVNYLNLRKNIGDYLNIDPDYIVPGNGASEIIYLLMKILDGPLGIINPTFSEYERAANLNNVEIINLQLNDEFKIDLKEIQKNIDKFKYLFICNPNNPTGSVQNLKELFQSMKNNEKYLIVDETFMEFVYENEKYSLINYIEEYDNLIIIKAITKFFGLPGIRLGYGVTSNFEILNKLWSCKEPWTVNSFAENICNYIFKEKDYINETRNYFKEEIHFMTKELNNISNLEVFESNTNFILLKLNKYNSTYVKERLFIEKNILIRDASNFKGLDENYIRVAVKRREDNKALIKALNELLGE